MEPNQRGGGRGRGGRPRRIGHSGRGINRGVPTQAWGRSRGTASNSARRGNRGSRYFREPSTQTQLGAREGASSAEVLNAADLSTERRVGERSLLTNNEDVERERGSEGRTAASLADIEPIPVPFAFPSFEEVTTGSGSTSTVCGNIFEFAKGALVDHTHKYFRKAIREKVSASLGDLTVVPQRSLGRTIFVTTCDRLRQGAIGNTIALVDMKQRSICYGEIVQMGKKQVFLPHNCEDVLGIQPSYAFTMVDTNLNASFCLELSSILVSKKESSLLHTLWLSAGKPVGGTGPSSVATLQCPKTPAVLDQSQREAFCAGVSEQVALIHAPSGCGAKRLLKAMADYLCLNEQSLEKQPVLIIVKNPLQLQVKLRWTHDDVFNMNGEQMHELTKMAQQSLEAVIAFGEIKVILSRVHDLLLEMYDAETSILHQSFFEGITRAFSLKRSEEKNLLEGWLMGNLKYQEMRSSVSRSEFQRFQEHCKRRPGKPVDEAGPPNENVCFTFDRSSHACSNLHQHSFTDSDQSSIKAAYVWKTLRGTVANASLMSVKDIRELELRDRWMLYKHWVGLFLKIKERELRETLQHLATSAERYKQAKMEARACLKINQPVVMASPVTAVTHCSLFEILKPRVTILCDATEIEDFCAPALLAQSTEKVICIGNSLHPHQTSSFWRCLLESGSIQVHEMVFQYFQSQEVCDLLSPILKFELKSKKKQQRVNGVRETVQFFNIPDSAEAAFMISRLCVHLQAHNYESSDVAVLVLSPQPGAIRTLKKGLQQQGCTFSVTTAVAFYPTRCKIAVVYLAPGSLGAQFAVGLSRVCFAVYGFGDFSKVDESCQNVLNSAKERNEDLFRGSLSLTCICHPGKVISVASRQDFETKLYDHGFCLDHSSSALRCGHKRVVLDLEGHTEVARCEQPCEKTICKRNHRCPNKCSDPCSELCTQLAKEKLPMCGHDASLPCHQLDAVLDVQNRTLDANSSSSSRQPPHAPYKCTVEITKKRPCGHWFRTRCCESLHNRCRELRENTLPTCGHIARLACYMWDEPDNLVGHKCTKMVSVKASCGHHASVPCHKLDYRMERRPGLPAGHQCTHEVMKTAPCGHQVKSKCFESPSSPCQECKSASWKLNTQHGLQASMRSAHGASSQKVPSPSQEAATKLLPCGHPVPVERSIFGKHADLECRFLVPFTRQCGHVLRLPCSSSHLAFTFAPCGEMVETSLRCGHKVSIRCSDSLSSRSYVSGPLCDVVIRKTLACGHVVRGPCWRTSRESSACSVIVEKVLRCGHSVSRLCSDNSPCSSACSVRLSCGHTCYQRCDGHAKHKCRTCEDKCCIS